MALCKDVSAPLADEDEFCFSQVSSRFSDKNSSRVENFYLPDPKQELADSLPLCLGNKDYLKDFATGTGKYL